MVLETATIPPKNSPARRATRGPPQAKPGGDREAVLHAGAEGGNAPNRTKLAERKLDAQAEHQCWTDRSLVLPNGVLVFVAIWDVVQPDTPVRANRDYPSLRNTLLAQRTWSRGSRLPSACARSLAVGRLRRGISQLSVGSVDPEGPIADHTTSPSGWPQKSVAHAPFSADVARLLRVVAELVAQTANIDP
jgi:hypothetical protein